MNEYTLVVEKILDARPLITNCIMPLTASKRKDAELIFIKAMASHLLHLLIIMTGGINFILLMVINFAITYIIIQIIIVIIY